MQRELRTVPWRLSSSLLGQEIMKLLPSVPPFPPFFPRIDPLSDIKGEIEPAQDLPLFFFSFCASLISFPSFLLRRPTVSKLMDAPFPFFFLLLDVYSDTAVPSDGGSFPSQPAFSFSLADARNATAIYVVPPPQPAHRRNSAYPLFSYCIFFSFSRSKDNSDVSHPPPFLPSHIALERSHRRGTTYFFPSHLRFLLSPPRQGIKGVVAPPPFFSRPAGHATVSRGQNEISPPFFFFLSFRYSVFPFVLKISMPFPLPFFLALAFTVR